MSADLSARTANNRRIPVPGMAGYAWPPREAVEPSDVEQLEAHAVLAIEALVGRIASATLERRTQR